MNVVRSIVSLLLSLIIAVSLEMWFRFVILVWDRNDPERQIADASRMLRVWGISTFWAVKAALGLKLVVEGEPPRSGSYLVVANHQASLDIPMMISVFRDVHLKFVAMEELRNGKPAVSFMLRTGGFAFVSKHVGRDLAELTRLGLQVGRHGGSPALFPEGRRTEDGSIGPWHYGGIEAVRRTSRLPLLPVTIDGLWEGRTIKEYHKVVGKTITIRISKPVPFDEVEQDPRMIYEELERENRRQLDEIRGRVELDATETGAVRLP